MPAIFFLYFSFVCPPLFQLKENAETPFAPILIFLYNKWYNGFAIERCVFGHILHHARHGEFTTTCQQLFSHHVSGTKNVLSHSFRKDYAVRNGKYRLGIACDEREIKHREKKSAEACIALFRIASLGAWSVR